MVTFCGVFGPCWGLFLWSGWGPVCFLACSFVTFLYVGLGGWGA